MKRHCGSFRFRWAILFAAFLLSLTAGCQWRSLRHRAASEASSSAAWALPETDAERRALAAAGGPHGAEQLGDY